MVDLPTGLNAVLSALELLKVVKTASDAVVRTNAIAEIQEKLIGLQNSYSELFNKNSELERRLHAKETWEKEAARYQLHDFGGSTYAYIIREDQRGNEPDHRLCSNCFVQEQKSILQFKFGASDRREHWNCPRCEIDFEFGAKASSTSGGWRQSGGWSDKSWMG